MKARCGALVLFAIFSLLTGALAWAGNPVFIVGGGNTSFSASRVGATTDQTITLTFNDNNIAGQGASLSALGFTGTNASDFAIVGGTCAPGTTVLDAAASTCTVIVQYRPSTSASESATFTGTCTQVSLVGGFALSCNGNSGTILSLGGAVLAAVAQLPSLDPRMLTALCLLMLAVGGYFAGRKKV
jgi:hypothetical protein